MLENDDISVPVKVRLLQISVHGKYHSNMRTLKNDSALVELL